MIERKVDIVTSDGIMDCFLCHPQNGGPFPAVILYMDAIGVREELREMARRLGAAGYAVLLPNLFYRTAPASEIVIDADLIEEKGGDDRARMWSLIKSIDNAKVVADSERMLDFLPRDSGVGSGPVGCLGYCMSGQYVYSVAAHYPDRVAAVASFYGAGLVTERPDSPHLLTGRIAAELYLAFAEEDSYVPDANVETLREVLGNSSVRHLIETYPGTVHGFAFPGRKAFNKTAAERHWERIFELFARTLAGA